MSALAPDAIPRRTQRACRALSAFGCSRAAHACAPVLCACSSRPRQTANAWRVESHSWQWVGLVGELATRGQMSQLMGRRRRKVGERGEAAEVSVDDRAIVVAPTVSSARGQYRSIAWPSLFIEIMQRRGDDALAQRPAPLAELSTGGTQWGRQASCHRKVHTSSRSRRHGPYRHMRGYAGAQVR